MDICTKIGLLTDCYCAGSGKEGIMEDVERGKYVHKENGHMHKNQSIYQLLLCRYIVVKKV